MPKLFHLFTLLTVENIFPEYIDKIQFNEMNFLRIRFRKTIRNNKVCELEFTSIDMAFS